MQSIPKTKQKNETKNTNSWYKNFLPDSAEDTKMNDPLFKYLNYFLNVSFAF